MSQPEQFLSRRQRYRPITLPEQFSDEEMVRDWTLFETDRSELRKYHKKFRLNLAIQVCSVRLYGRFLNPVQTLSPRIISYLSQQLELPPSLTIEIPEREATYLEQRQNILKYLGFERFSEPAQDQLEIWVEQRAKQGLLPNEIFLQAEGYLLEKHILLPGPSVLERLIIRICSTVHQDLFQSVFEQLSPEIQQSIDALLKVPKGEQRSRFHALKAYPPAASISSLKSYLERYQSLVSTGIDAFEARMLTPEFMDYWFKLAKRYSAKDLKRFSGHKRYTLMVCFLLETRKILLDHLVKMHEQYLMDMSRKARNIYEEKHRKLRKRQKKAVDRVLDMNDYLLDFPKTRITLQSGLWERFDKAQLRDALDDLRDFKRLEERGYADLMLARYPSLRKYFAEFIQLPFAAEPGNETLMRAIGLVRQLDSGEIKALPSTAPIDFVPKVLRPALLKDSGLLSRNAWELGVAFALKDALRSGDLYLPQSKHHVSFWDLTLSQTRWEQVQDSVCDELQQPPKEELKTALPQQFQQVLTQAQARFKDDDFATLVDGKLKLKRYDKVPIPPEVAVLQKVINSRLPYIRIEQLLMEVEAWYKSG